MSELTTRASSINRALDQIGDKWCLLIIQEVLWGINTFTDMMDAMGVSRGVLSNRLKWLQEIDCLRRDTGESKTRRPTYHLTAKSIALYDGALMAVSWERAWFTNPDLDNLKLVHEACGEVFVPQMHCSGCNEQVRLADVSYTPGPGATRDVREKKVRRRSSLSVMDVPSKRALYLNLVNVVGDRWTANVIALAFHNITRFEAFHRELPVATNILSDRLRFLVGEGIFEQVVYQQRPPRSEYLLTPKGRDLFPWFFSLMEWGDEWCDPDGRGKPMLVNHTTCGAVLKGETCCSHCLDKLIPHEVQYTMDGEEYEMG